MKSKEVKAIANDLVHLISWKSPLVLLPIQPDKKYEINLLTGKLNVNFKDSITEYLIEKHKWFLNRIKDLNSKLEDFKEALITILIRKEKVTINYKTKKFESERIY